MSQDLKPLKGRKEEARRRSQEEPGEGAQEPRGAGKHFRAARGSKIKKSGG